MKIIHSSVWRGEIFHKIEQHMLIFSRPVALIGSSTSPSLHLIQGGEVSGVRFISLVFQNVESKHIWCQNQHSPAMLSHLDCVCLAGWVSSTFLCLSTSRTFLPESVLCQWELIKDLILGSTLPSSENGTVDGTVVTFQCVDSVTVWHPCLALCCHSGHARPRLSSTSGRTLTTVSGRHTKGRQEDTQSSNDWFRSLIVR